MKPVVSVVVPFYNEDENVPVLAAKIDEVFDALSDYEAEYLFVNDGSTDGTREQLDRLQQGNPRTRAIHLVENRGQSAALMAGMRRARGDYILTLDGDLQNDPVDFPTVLKLLQEYDCVCGYRAKRQDTWVRKVSSRLANSVRRAILDDGIRDSGCGLKGFRKCCVQHLVPFNGVHRFFAVMVRNGGLTLTECEVTHHPRVHGVSKYGIHNRLWRGIYDLFGVRWLQKRYVTYQVEGEE
jgi:glycosyltransferase involved in cell wall biosynthesis